MSRVSALLVLLLSVLLASSVEAQVYALRFKSEKDAGKFKKQSIEWNGEQVVLVEVKRGLDKKDNVWQVNPQTRIEFYIQNQEDPSDLPYKVTKDGKAEAGKKKLTIAIMGDKFGSLQPYMDGESFYTLSKEYERRMRLLDDLETAREEFKKGSPQWLGVHDGYVQELEMLGAWMHGAGYVRGANKLQRTIIRAKKLMDVARNERLEAAVASVKTVEPPPALNEAAARVGGEKLKFKMQESLHLRIVYHDGLGDERIAGLLELGENAIDGFRREFVDPYLSEQFSDRIPDRLIDEFFFSTDSRQVQEQMYVEYYKMGWGARKEERLQSAGTGTRRTDGKGPGWRLDYWRLDDQSDLEGIMLHRLGHTLAELHYSINGNQDWLEEGVGYYLSFAYLNRNNVTCGAFEPPKTQEGTVARGPGNKDKDDETKTIVRLQGLREIMAEMALRVGPPFTQLAKTKLHAFENEHMAKSWAFFDYVAREEGLQGQIWLRAVAKAAVASQDAFIGKVRTATEEAYELTGTDALRELEKRWTDYLKRAYDVSAEG